MAEGLVLKIAKAAPGSQVAPARATGMGRAGTRSDWQGRDGGADEIIARAARTPTRRLSQKEKDDWIGRLLVRIDSGALGSGEYGGTHIR